MEYAEKELILSNLRTISKNYKNAKSRSENILRYLKGYTQNLSDETNNIIVEKKDSGTTEYLEIKILQETIYIIIDIERTGKDYGTKITYFKKVRSEKKPIDEFRIKKVKTYEMDSLGNIKINDQGYQITIEDFIEEGHLRTILELI